MALSFPAPVVLYLNKRSIYTAIIIFMAILLWHCMCFINNGTFTEFRRPNKKIKKRETGYGSITEIPVTYKLCNIYSKYIGSVSSFSKKARPFLPTMPFPNAILCLQGHIFTIKGLRIVVGGFSICRVGNEGRRFTSTKNIKSYLIDQKLVCSIIV